MRLLAIETATDNCSVALLAAGELRCRSNSTPRNHAQSVLGMVEECLQEANLELNDLDALVFGRGPGSFTGLRIAVGVVQGLAFGASLPVIPVSSLAAHAAAIYRAHEQDRVAVCVDARMGECYWGVFQIDEVGVPQLLDQERLGAPGELPGLEGGDWFGSGSGWGAYPALNARYGAVLCGTDDTLLPEASDLLASAGQKLKSGRVLKAEMALPVYLREQVAWRN